VQLDRDLRDAVKAMDVHQLRRLLMLAQARLGAETHVPRSKLRFREQSVRCGKTNCTKCPHGPYWYAYWQDGERRRSAYLGKLAPTEAVETLVQRR